MKYDENLNRSSIDTNNIVDDVTPSYTYTSNSYTNNGGFLDYNNLFNNKPDCLDDYEILDIIGEGGYGKVYKARKYDRLKQDYEFFAIKHIAVPKNQSVINDMKLGYTNSGIKDIEFINQNIKVQLKSMVDNCLKEVNIMNELSQYAGYKYIVKIENSAVVERKNSIGYDIFIIMELLISLDQFILNNRDTYLNFIDIVKIGIDICSALEQCEYNSIIHRDIKPSNIFVNINNSNNTIINYKLGDFGTAKYTDINSTLTTDVGTLEYMSSQQKDGIFSYTNDVYSLGLVMYKLLNRFRMPFCPLPEEKSFLSPLDKEKAKKRLDSGKEIVPPPIDADKYLSEIVLKACAFNIEDRYQHAKDFKKDLIDYQNGVYVPKLTLVHTNNKDKIKTKTKTKTKTKKNKNIKYAIAFICTLVVLGVSYKFVNNASDSLDFSIEPYQNGIMINNYIGNSKDIKVPSTIDGQDVVAIANSTFENSDIKSIIIPNTVKEIHNGAFKGCSNLESVTLSNSIEVIEEDCFDSCIKLKSITLPSTLKNFDETFFDNCPMLLEININEENPNYTSVDGVVFTNDMSNLICYPEGRKNESYTIPNEVTNISKYAIENNNNLKEIIVSSSVNNIDENAFINCDNLEKVVIGNNVSEIKKDILDGSNKAVIYCEKESYAMHYAIDNKLVYNTGSGNIEYSYEYNEEYNGLNITSYFGRNTEVNIPNQIDGFNVIGISERAFAGNNNIQYVVIPDGVVNVELDAFKDCSSLQTITLPSTLQFLSQGVFMNDSSLESINIPSDITTIYDYTFCGCASLKTIEIPNTVKEFLGDDIFTGCDSLTIYCDNNSSAHKYAQEHSINFNID